MQANRAMRFQKNCTKTERIGETFINAFIANAVGDGSWRISGFVDTAHHTIGNGIVFTVPSAAIRLPAESIILPVPRTVSDVAGDGATARRNDAYRREGDEIDKGDEGDCYPRNCRSQIETDQKNRGGIPQCPSERIRFVRRGENRGVWQEDGKDGIGRRKTICLVCQDVC